MTTRAERIAHDPATCPAFGGCNDCRSAKFEAASPDVVISADVEAEDDRPPLEPWEPITFNADPVKIPREYIPPEVDPVDYAGVPAFNAAADATLARAGAVHTGRGREYGDTWALENIVTTYLDHVLHMLGVFGLSREERRLLESASLVDVKESRIKHGPWKLDNSDDGINYRASFATWREEYREANGI